MPTTTGFMSIPQPASGDPFADGDDIMRAIADRVDYLLGESGDNTITPSAASTKTTKVIPFGRTYKTPPRVVLSPGRDNYSATIGQGTMSLWIDDVSTTTFTVGIRANSVGTEAFTWMARPNRTDVTP